MNFLSPLVLAVLLPMALLPVIIHLVNRLRYRTVQWGAMAFLFEARRDSTRMARIRHWLVLILRVLALAALAFALARPVSGLLGGFWSGRDLDEVYIVIDRSSSMRRSVGPDADLCLLAGRRLAQTLSLAAPRAHVTILDGGDRRGLSLKSAAQLADGQLAAATDGAADLPDMTVSALTLAAASQAERIGVWVVSDMQRSSFKPGDPRWAEAGRLVRQIGGRLASLQVMPVHAGESSGHGVRLLSASIERRGGSSVLVLAAEVRASSAGDINVLLNVNGNDTALTWTLSSARQVIHHEQPLAAEGAVFGRVRLAQDESAGDNSSYFAVAPLQERKVRIYSGAGSSQAAVLAALAAPDPDLNLLQAQLHQPQAFAAEQLEQCPLVILDGVEPQGAMLEQLQAFAAKGGVILALPAVEGGAAWPGLSFGAAQKAESGSFVIGGWEEKEGPLRPGPAGQALALGRSRIDLRHPMQAQGLHPLATCTDGSPLLQEKVLGAGSLYLLGARFGGADSDLDQGTWTLPLIQRLAEQGGRRLDGVRQLRAGQSVAGTALLSEEIVGGAGVWRGADGVLTLLQRPVDEDEPARVEEPQVRTDLAEASITPIGGDTASTLRAGEGSLWRLFALAMLLFLLAEGLLTLRPAPVNAKETTV